MWIVDHCRIYAGCPTLSLVNTSLEKGCRCKREQHIFGWKTMREH